MEDATRQFENVIYSEIPLSRVMGVSVFSYDGKKLSLHAPLDKNTNHKSTAFGGSLYNLAVLTGWGLVYLKLLEEQLSAHIVIQKSEIDYLLPVTTDLITQCSIENSAALKKCFHTYIRKKRSRIHLTVNIFQGKECAVCFRGTYVIHK